MVEAEYRDRQELETEIKDYAQKIETLAEEQKDHQEDLEKLQKAHKMLKSSAGFYHQSDNQLAKQVEAAIKTRESNVENCKEKIGEIKSDIESKLENFKRSLKKAQERVTQMEQVVESLNGNDKKEILDSEIQQNKQEIEDAKDKCISFQEIIAIASGLATIGDIAANRIAEFISYLHTTGLLR